jgi:hypothetical protein
VLKEFKMSDDWGDEFDDDEFCAIADEVEADHSVNVSGILDFKHAL